MTRDLAERCKDRWPDILRQLGMLSSAALAGKDVPCPMCGGIDRFRFSDKGFGRWFCRGCGYGGDGVRLIQAIKRVDFAEAATIVEGVVGKVSQPTSHPADAGSGEPRDPLKSWRNAGPFLHSPLSHPGRLALAKSDASGESLVLTQFGMGVIGSERRRCEQASFHRSRCWRSPAVTACLGSWPALIILIGVMLITWSTEVDPPTTAERPRLHTGRCGGGSWGMRQLLLWPPPEPPPTAESSSFLLLKRLRVAQLVEEALKAMRGPALAD